MSLHPGANVCSTGAVDWPALAVPAPFVVTVTAVEPRLAVVDRPVLLTRDGARLRLTFPYRPDLVEAVKTLPGARFDGETRTWTVPLCTQVVDGLRTWHYRGWTDVAVDDLLHPGDVITPLADAVVAAGSRRRPYQVRMEVRSDQLYQRLKSLPGGRWDRDLGGFSFPPYAWAGLSELARRGVIVDPDGLLTPHAVTIGFDAASGRLAVRGDERAEAHFATHFPTVDVVAVWRQRDLDVGFSDDLAAEVYAGELARHSDGFEPDGLTVPLYPYQRVDVAVACARSSLLIASEPGTGKTAVAVATGHELVTNRAVVPRVVIVVPGGVRSHWAREIRRFTGATDDDIVVVDGDRAARDAAYQRAADARWLIVHYEVLHRDEAQLLTLCNDALLILDEAHRVKTPTAKRTKCVAAMRKRAARSLALSGTPVEVAPGELYTLMDTAVIPGVLGSPSDFLNRYSYPARFGGYEGARNLDELQDRIATHLLRRRKAEVAEHLPALLVSTVTLDAEPAYAAALRRAHRQARDEIAAGRVASRPVSDSDERDEVETGAEMTAVGMLRLLCTSPRLVTDSPSPAAAALREAGLIPDEDGPKLDRLRTMAVEAQAAGERLLVFTSSRTMADLVIDRLTTDGIRSVRYTGTTPTKEREAAVLAFTTPATVDDPGPTVMVSTDAGAEGLNLGRCCSTLVALDLPWTAARAWQRANRIHRVDGDPTRRYTVINLVIAGTLEDGILRLLESRADLSDAILGDAGGRARVTGRRSRNLYHEVLQNWSE